MEYVATSGLDDGRTNRMGRADLHIHTVASDGVSSVVEILDAVAAREDLAVIAITDHERIDAAVAGRSIAHDRGLRTEIVVGEEISTRGGHLLGLFLEHPVKPLRSLRNPYILEHEADPSKMKRFPEQLMISTQRDVMAYWARADPERTCMPAGQGVGSFRGVRPAADVFREILDGAARVLERGPFGRA